MTKKDFQMVADAIRAERPVTVRPGYTEIADTTCDRIAQRLADGFAADNPRFDRDLFLTATRRKA